MGGFEGKYLGNLPQRCSLDLLKLELNAQKWEEGGRIIAGNLILPRPVETRPEFAKRGARMGPNVEKRKLY